MRVEAAEKASKRAEAQFIDHCKQLADFTLRHTLNRPNPLYTHLLAKRLCAVGLEHNAQEERISRLEEIDYAVLYFFYSHGN